MKHHKLTTAQAAAIQEVLRKIERAAKKSPVMMAALDIDKHEIKKVTAVLKNLEK